MMVMIVTVIRRMTMMSIDNSPSLEVTKTSAITDNGDGVVGKGDVVQYTISVINNGNVTLSSLTVSDILSDANSGTTFFKLWSLVLRIITRLSPRNAQSRRNSEL